MDHLRRHGRCRPARRLVLGRSVRLGPDPADGCLDVDAVLSRYAATTGRALDDLPYYQAFALWRLAAIAEGVAARFRAGVMGAQDVDVDELSRRPARLAETAREILARGESIRRLGRGRVA
nr:hypothetical protein [Nocardia brevicatena]